MADLFHTANEQRAAILARERAVSGELVRIYGQTYQTIRGQIRVLQVQMDAAILHRETINTGWLFERERLRTLQGQVERELLRFADAAELAITGEQRAQIAIAREHITAQITAGRSSASGVSFSSTRLPTGPIQELVGVLADGSPLHALLAELGPDAAKVVGDGLLQGVATGQDVDQIARNIRKGLGGNLARAQTIARTEVLRSYRESARQTALVNQEVLKGWRWTASKSRRTCMSCIALDGTLHPISERLAEHVRGRCVAVYLPRGVDLAMPETGAAWFDRQSDEVQAQMLGPSKFAAFKDGALTLSALVGTTHSHAWGTSHHEQSLTAALGTTRARKYLDAARTGNSAA